MSRNARNNTNEKKIFIAWLLATFVLATVSFAEAGQTKVFIRVSSTTAGRTRLS